MKEGENFTLTGKDGNELLGTEWLVDSPKAVVCMIHGLGEYMGRYAHVAEYLNSSDISFYGIDLRGHGSSEGKRGHTPSYDLLLDDVEELLMYARAEYNDLPIFLYGHSLGGNIVTNYILQKNVNELQGAIISSPWFKLAKEPPQWQIKLARSFSKIFPSLTQSNQLDVSDLTNDELVNKAYKNDSLVHDRISTRLFTECYRQGLWALEHTDRNKLELLMFHGAEDPITSHDASLEFANNAGDQVTYKLWKGTKHEPHNDVKKEEVLNMISDWIAKRLDF